MSEEHHKVGMPSGPGTACNLGCFFSACQIGGIKFSIPTAKYLELEVFVAHLRKSSSEYPRLENCEFFSPAQDDKLEIIHGTIFDTASGIQTDGFIRLLETDDDAVELMVLFSAVPFSGKDED